MASRESGAPVRLGAVLAAGAAILFAGCVTVPPEEDPVLLKIGELESRLQAIEGRLSNEALIDMAAEVARLQDEVRALRGEVDVVINDLAAMQEGQRNIYVQLDDRMTALERGGVAAGGAAAAAGTGGGAATDAPSDRELYDRGFDLLKQQRYGEAGEAFAALVRSQPDSSLAGAAQYWYAETFYVQREFETALENFQRVIEAYPRSSKAADARLKAGFCQYELGDYQKARATLERVASEYAGTPAARLAAERLDRMRAEGR